MPIHRCCVEGCSSRKPQVKLFNLPTNDALREIWTQYLMRRSPALQDTNQTKESLTQRKVCILHFEDKYLIGDKRKRLSCPTLFSEEEILSRKPSSPIEFSFEKVHFDDHSYSFQSENTPGPSIQQLYQNEIGDTTLRLKHVMKDHTYALKTSKKSTLDGNECLEDPEPEIVPEGPYSWQKTPLVCADDVEEVSNDESPVKEPPVMTLTGDVEPEYTDYVCNKCNCNIYGVRYKCVQCSDYDVCTDCESRGVHALHYALRVPEHSAQDEVLRVIEAIKKCLNENRSMIMIPEVEGIKEEIKDEDNESDVEESDPVRREEQLDPQASEQEDSSDIHIVPASYAEAVPVKTANTILVRPTNRKPIPFGHSITIPVGHSNSAPVKLIGLQEVGSRDIGSPKNISLRKNIVLKSNLLLPPINKTTITSQNVNTMSLSNLRGNTVVLAERDADGNLIGSNVSGKPHLAENHHVIDLEDPNTKKPRYSEGKDEQTSQPARLNVNTMSLSNLRENTVVLAEIDADGNLIGSNVSGKRHLAENHTVIDLEDPNTKKFRYSEGKYEQTSQPARLSIGKQCLLINSRLQHLKSSDDQSSIVRLREFHIPLLTLEVTGF